RGTILGGGESKMHTVEHVMAALWAFGITNLRIELDAEEPPVGDGSSLSIIEMIEEAGIIEQKEPAHVYKVREPITISDKDAWITILPYPGLKISYTLAYDHPLVGVQYKSFDFNKIETFRKEIANCRTFCFYREVEALMDRGLIQGGSLDNAVVIGDEAILSKEGLRFPDEFARHKILDLLGDLYLLGTRIEGHVVAVKSGHSLNVKIVQSLREKIASDKNASEGQKTMLNITDIKKILPHRYPFLLIDRIVEMNEQGARGIKNVTANEEYFNGHFPEQPLMPAVLQIEAMAQVAGAAFLKSRDLQNKRAVLAGIENAKFRRPVIPGDQLMIEITYGKFKNKIGKASGIITVNKEIVSEAVLTFALLESIS
ncbi:MAG: UDP-3-O-[3-hydroxymyristoyl] N-acetylglucosamine deacetylase, partial [Candidatus Aureabacteria bacterium]|nr:UDP-3-O-[3-hydroxymyristoyl] N-acetylglucosamine deacetylase [Candidatus Auribacterota bacterium]